jgi:hypothetical protein
MINKNVMNNIISSINQVIQQPNLPLSYSITPFKGIRNKRHHFLTFLKPEILSFEKQVNINEVLNFVFSHYAKWRVDIGGMRVLSGRYLKEKNIISKNYETLHKISYYGERACSENILFKLYDLFSSEIFEGAEILGGHQFLEIFSNISERWLDELVSQQKTIKIGSGAYAVSIVFNKKPYIILNGFYPYQSINLTTSGEVVVAIECISDHHWPILRNDFVGSIYPQSANINSFRREIFERKDKFNIKDIDIAHNGIHISPGPIESVFQLFNFFAGNNINIESFITYTILNGHFSTNKIKSLEKNPFMKQNNNLNSTIFELTEDMNSDEAINFLKNMTFIK